jgi:peptidoglycan/xylan/chitin deacetylase (PgdA/CDA1 family)
MKYLYLLLIMIGSIFPQISAAEPTVNIPILVYHNLNPTKPGSMNITPQKFETELRWIKDNGFTVIPLKEAVEYLQGKRPSVPPKSVVITADDGWQSAYTYIIPIMKKYKMPLTLFIYPETISKGKNAMTWDELREVQKSDLIDIQGHTYSHPNFKHAKRDMSPDAYSKFVRNELFNSKKILEDKLHTKIQFLAWPFGIYNDELEQAAKDAGYEMAFTINYQAANRGFRPMAQPRFMIIDAQSLQTFAGLVKTAKTTES